MTEIPAWFGKNEFYLLIITVWFFLISWMAVNLIKVGGIKLNIKDKYLKIKTWWVKRKENKML